MWCDGFHNLCVTGMCATGQWKFKCSLYMTMSLLWQWGMIQVVCCRKVPWKAGDMQGTRMRFLIAHWNFICEWDVSLNVTSPANNKQLLWTGVGLLAVHRKKGHNLLSLELTRITETKHLPFGQLKAEYEHCQLKTVWGRHGSNDWAPSELSIECGFILRCGHLNSISQKKCACCLTGPENCFFDVVVLKSTFRAYVCLSHV